MDKELINYISRGRGAGVLDEELRDILIDAGWPVEDINQALKEAGSHLPIINAGPAVVESPLEWTSAHKGVFLLVIVAIAVVFLSVAGVFVYQAYLYRQSPDQAAGDMLEAMSRVTSFNYDGSLNLDLSYQSSVVGNSTSSVELPNVLVGERSTTTISFSGAVLAPEAARPKFLWAGKIRVDQLNHGVFNAEVEARLIDDALYVFLSNIDRLPLLDLRSLVGFWLSITPADMADFDVGSSITAPSANQLIVWRNAIARSQSFHLIEKLGVEKIDDVETVKYSFSLSLAESKDFIDHLVEVSEPADLRGRVGALSKQEKIMGEIWIGKRDDLPYRVDIRTAFNDDGHGDISDSKGNINLNLNFSNFNQELSVVVPESPRSLSSVSEDLIGGQSSSTTASTQPKP